MTDDHSSINDPDLAEHLDILRLLGDGLDLVEPIPPHLLDLAYNARDMTAVEAELAELVFDSLADTQPMRSEQEMEARFLSFANENITIDLSLLSDGRSIVGEISPPVTQEVLLEATGAAPMAFPVDEIGRFVARSESVTFRFRVAGLLVTQWISR